MKNLIPVEKLILVKLFLARVALTIALYLLIKFQEPSVKEPTRQFDR